MKTPLETIMSSFSLGSGEQHEAPQVKTDDTNQSEFENRLGLIESRMPMPTAADGIETDILQLDANLRPRWSAALIPSGTTEGDMLVWDDTLEKWIVFTSSIDLILMWSASLNKWQQVEVPATDGVILQTYTPVSGEPPLKFDILRFTV